MPKSKHNRPRRLKHVFAESIAPAHGLVASPPDVSVVIEDYGDAISLRVAYPMHAKSVVKKKDIPAAETYRFLAAELGDYLLDSDKLFDLAHAAHELYLLLVPAEAQTYIESARAAERSLRIDVASDDFTFPFGLLYTRDPEEDLDVRWFLGFQHILSRLPKFNGFIGQQPPELHNGPPKISYALHDSLDDAVNHEIPRIERLSQQRKGFHVGEVAHLGSFDGTRTSAAVGELRAVIKKQAPHILHLACHGSIGEGADPAVFAIDNGLLVTTKNFQKRDYVFEKGPLVFLNACEMGCDSTNKFHSFVDLMFDMKARAVIAPECVVPSARASRFASSFYKWFVRYHLPAADALHAARHERLDRANDPIGLAYSLYGQPETFVSPKGDRA